jgi:hypothetical protein
MSYGTIKVDTITFTDNSVDKSVSLSGLIQNPTFTGNITVTGTISGDVIRGGTTVSGATVTGTTANFVSGVFTTQISGATVTGTTASFTSGVFTNISGTTATITSGIIASGTDAAPSLAILADLDTGLFSPGANQLAVATNGTGRLFVDASGNVGVGTPSPNDPLTIVSSGTANSIVSAFDATASRAYFQVGGTTNGLYTQIGTDTSTTFINDFFGNGIAFQLAASEKARIDSSGRLGIGTSSPQRLLHVNTVGDTYVRIGGNRGDAADLHIGNIEFENTFNSQGVIAEIRAITGSSGTHSSKGQLAFYTDDGSSYGERVRIDSSGRLGIGTTLCGAPLSFADTNEAKIQFNADSANFFRIGKFSGELRFTAGETSPGAFTFSSGGSEKARIDDSGRLLVGTSTSTSATINDLVGKTQIASSENAALALHGHSSTALYGADIVFTRSRSATIGTNTIVQNGDEFGRIYFTGANGTGFDYGASIQAVVDGTPGVGDMPGRLVFSTTADGGSSPTERMRIDSSGRVGIGTTGPSSILSLGVASAGVDGTKGVRITNPAGTVAMFECGVFSDSYIGTLSGSDFSIRTNNAPRISVTNAGNVGIGTTSPRRTLEVSGADGLLCINATDTSTGTSQLLFGDNDDDNIGRIYYDHGTDNMAFWTNTSEKARIDTSGRLLVGTSSWANTSKAVFSGNSSDNLETYVDFNRGTAATAADSFIALLNFRNGGSDTCASIICQTDAACGSGDSPGRLVFSTTADGASSPTERLRIRESGTQYAFSANDGITASVSPAASTGGALFEGRHSASGVATGTPCFVVRYNGNVQNTNNSYAAISDVKLKENIVNASSQWSDIKALQVRKYNLKEETGQQTHTQIGLVAQEVEPISPGLVHETPDRDEEGNDLGTVTKSVNYSVLYMKAVKALQEAMERIEALEADVVQLKGA